MNDSKLYHWMVTGAGGFLGRAVVGEALLDGHRITAIVRPTSMAAMLEFRDCLDLESRERLHIVSQDLRRCANPANDGFVRELECVDGVLHLAAAKGGAFSEQFAATVSATEQLLAAMRTAKCGLLVQISSFAVYDYIRIKRRSELSAESPVIGPYLTESANADDRERLKREYQMRDAYAICKRMQEELAHDFAQLEDTRVSILRPGVIYGPGALWNARLGFSVGKKYFVRTGARARLPLVSVHSTAREILAAAGRLANHPQCKLEVVNVVDPDAPTQKSYLRWLCKYTERGRRLRVIAVNYSLMRFALAALAAVNRRLFAGRFKLPGLLVADSFEARCRPLRYKSHTEEQGVGV